MAEEATARGSFIVMDLRGFRGLPVARSDVDRMLRDLLDLVSQALERSCSLMGCPLGDVKRKIRSGDQIFVLPPAKAQHRVLCSHFVHDFEYLLREYNHNGPEWRQMRVRAVLDFDDYKVSCAVDGEPTGYDCLDAFQLVDSGTLHDLMESRPKDQPLAVMISKRYYTEVITQKLRPFISDFEAVKLEGKGIKPGDEAWLPAEYLRDDQARANNDRLAELLRKVGTLESEKISSEAERKRSDAFNRALGTLLQSGIPALLAALPPPNRLIEMAASATTVSGNNGDGQATHCNP